MFTLDLSGLDDLQKRFDARTARIGQECTAAVKEQLTATQNLAKSLAPRGETGDLIKGIVQQWDSMSANGMIGSVESRAAHSRPVADGAKPHEIMPRNASVLRFQIGSKTVFARRVSHPGNAANLFWWRAIQATRQTFRTLVSEHVQRALRG